MTDERSSPLKFIPAEATTPDGKTLAVMLVEDPPGYVRPATRVEEELYGLLRRIQAWDVLNPSAPDGSDAPYWQAQIAGVIGERRA